MKFGGRGFLLLAFVIKCGTAFRIPPPPRHHLKTLLNFTYETHHGRKAEFIQLAYVIIHDHDTSFYVKLGRRRGRSLQKRICLYISRNIL